MRTLFNNAAVLVFLTASNMSAVAQPPKGKAPDDDRPRLDAPADAPRPRRSDARPGDDGPPPPAKGRQRGDSPPYPQSPPITGPGMPGPPNYFGGPGMRSGGPAMPGYGGFGGGMRGGGFPGGMPGAAGPFGEPSHDDPQMRELIKQDAELEQQSMQTAHRVREATGEERQKLRESLADVVVKHFEVRQKRRELQIKRMEDELKRLRDEIAKRNDARKTIIDNRLREMTGDPRELDF